MKEGKKRREKWKMEKKVIQIKGNERKVVE